MKRIFYLVLLILIVTSANSLACAVEPKTIDKPEIDFYGFTEKDFNAFLNDFENPKYFDNATVRNNRPLPVIPGYYPDELNEAFKNNLFIDKYIRSRYPDIEIYDKKFVLPGGSFAPDFGLFTFIWVSTNYGVKVIEFMALYTDGDFIAPYDRPCGSVFYRSKNSAELDGFKTEKLLNCDVVYYDYNDCMTGGSRITYRECSK